MKETLIIFEISVDELRTICFPVIIETNQTLKEMITIETKESTSKKAKALSMMLFGEVTKACQHYIESGEEQCCFYIKRLCKEFGVMP